MPAQLIITPIAVSPLYHAALFRNKAPAFEKRISAHLMHFIGVAPHQDFAFPEGIPAFDEYREFRREANAAIAPLVVLRSLHPAPLRLICLPVEWIDPGYRLALGPTDLESLGGDVQGLELLAILTFHAQGPPTANLLAPIVLNHATGRGVQSIQVDSSYPPALPVPDGGSAPCS